MIFILINGRKEEVSEKLTLPQLFEHLKLKNLRFAVAINRQVIPKSEHGKTFLTEGDEVEIVHAVGGG